MCRNFPARGFAEIAEYDVSTPPNQIGSKSGSMNTGSSNRTTSAASASASRGTGRAFDVLPGQREMYLAFFPVDFTDRRRFDLHMAAR